MQIRMKLACALAVAGVVLGVSAAGYADSLAVKTEQGKVHGKTINDGKVKAFMGLPYAAAPRQSSGHPAPRTTYSTIWFFRTQGRAKIAFS